MWAIPTGTSLALKKNPGKESQYMVLHPELGSDPPIGSDRELGCDRVFNQLLEFRTMLEFFQLKDFVNSLMSERNPYSSNI